MSGVKNKAPHCWLSNNGINRWREGQRERGRREERRQERESRPEGHSNSLSPSVSGEKEVITTL